MNQASSADRIIKKYPNRRLYDTKISSYVTLEDLRELLMADEAFVVVDAKTGDDLTRVVLLQIIADCESQGEPMFSTEMLSQMVRFYGNAMQGMVRTYMDEAMNLFFEQQRQFQKQIGQTTGQNPWSMMQGLTEMNNRYWQQAQESFFTTWTTLSKQNKQ